MSPRLVTRLSHKDVTLAPPSEKTGRRGTRAIICTDGIVVPSIQMRRAPGDREVIVVQMLRKAGADKLQPTAVIWRSEVGNNR